jgi:PAN domain
MNLLFVIDTGLRYCGSGGCGETVYVDEGAGYKAAFDALTQDHDPVYVTRTGGRVFLYFGPPNIISQQANGLPVELILRDHKFVDNPPPPPPSPPPSSASVPSIPVRWYEGMDAPGSDFGPWLFSVANAEDCIRLCAQDSGCVGVTYNIRRSVCIRKTGIRSLNYTRDAATTGVLTDRTPAPDALAGPTPHTGLGIATTVNAASPPAALPGTPEASAKPADSMPSGPAAQVILQWFTTDRSLGCNDQQGNDSACTVGVNWPEFAVYYGDSTGGGPQADALAFVYYGPFPGGNMMSLAVAYFHRDGGNYRFIKTFPNVLGTGPIKGTTVRFLPGKANFSMAVLQGDDSRCCPTGRANYTVTLNPTSPTSPAPRVRHYENVDAPGNNRGNWIRGVSSADCESICIADSGCAGYTYNRSRATCIPKSIVVRLMSSSEPAVTGVVEGR